MSPQAGDQASKKARHEDEEEAPSKDEEPEDELPEQAGPDGEDDEEAWQRAVAAEMAIEYVDPKERPRLEKEQKEREKQEEQERVAKEEEEAKRKLFNLAPAGYALPPGGKVEMTVEEGRALFKVRKSGAWLELCSTDERSPLEPTLREEHLPRCPLGDVAPSVHQRSTLHPSLFHQGPARGLRRVLSRKVARAPACEGRRRCVQGARRPGARVPRLAEDRGDEHEDEVGRLQADVEEGQAVLWLGKGRSREGEGVQDAPQGPRRKLVPACVSAPLFASCCLTTHSNETQGSAPMRSAPRLTSSSCSLSQPKSSRILSGRRCDLLCSPLAISVLTWHSPGQAQL